MQISHLIVLYKTEECLPDEMMQKIDKDTKSLVRYFPNDSIEAIAQTEIRIAAQLDTLIEHGIRHAVFGAFGCGVFQNDPNIVANAYYKEIEKRKHKFDVIWFAMYRPGNIFQLFTSIFENFNKKQD